MSNEKKNESETAPIPEEQTVVTQNSVEIAGHVINYTATTGTVLLREEDEKAGHKPKAAVFYVAYTKNDVDTQNRPITFAFNGGPGSSSVWLHMGLLGPRRVLFDDVGNMTPPPYQLVNNEYSLLDVSDVVFIDPVSTGFSRAVPGEKANQFHEFEKDIESIADFIRLWTTRNNRWSSAKFLCGESYGTTRAAALSGYLQDKYGMYLNGLLMISTILNFQSALFHVGNDMPCILYLPVYAATAWYHEKLDAELQQLALTELLEQVEAFAEGEYASALMLGSKLGQAREGAIADKLARFMGVSAEFIQRNNLRVELHRFIKELRREERITVGRLDSRFTGIDRDAAGSVYEYDPSHTNITGPYTAVLNDYVRRVLGFESDLSYEILTDKVRPWDYGKKYANQYVNVAETLRGAMSRNPYLRVLFANGYYDLATPYFATEYTVNHLQLDPSLRDNIDLTYYEAGHMMYVHKASLAQLADDMRGFVQKSC
jgi:carboxypeptidase C (cathepsin A)